jgi:hypothetical protein
MGRFGKIKQPMKVNTLSSLLLLYLVAHVSYAQYAGVAFTVANTGQLPTGLQAGQGGK